MELDNMKLAQNWTLGKSDLIWYSAHSHEPSKLLAELALVGRVNIQITDGCLFLLVQVDTETPFSATIFKISGENMKIERQGMPT